MIVTVKSIKVLKSGTNQKGSWELVGVTGEDDTSYTTFNKATKNLPPGTIIDIGVPDEDEKGRLSFKEYKVVATTEPPEETHKPKVKTEMAPADWDRKQKIERESIEAQTAYKGIMELASSGQGEIIENTKLHDAFNVALDWALARLSTTLPKQPAPKATTGPKKPIEERTTKIDEQVTDKDKLYAFVAENMNFGTPKTSRAWIINKCKIPAERIDAEPEAVLKEVCELQGWSLLE